MEEDPFVAAISGRYSRLKVNVTNCSVIPLVRQNNNTIVFNRLSISFAATRVMIITKLESSLKDSM